MDKKTIQLFVGDENYTIISTEDLAKLNSLELDEKTFKENADKLTKFKENHNKLSKAHLELLALTHNLMAQNRELHAEINKLKEANEALKLENSRILDDLDSADDELDEAYESNSDLHFTIRVYEKANDKLLKLLNHSLKENAKTEIFSDDSERINH